MQLRARGPSQAGRGAAARMTPGALHIYGRLRRKFVSGSNTGLFLGCWRCGWAAFLLALAWSTQVHGDVILTEDTLPLPLARLPVSGPGGPGTLFLVDFGFGTFEQPTPGELHDSLTLTLSGFSDGHERLLATVDVFGVTAPLMVEGSGLFSGSPILVRERLAGSILGLAWSHQGAYTLSFTMPGDWTGQGELTGFFASNGDAGKSAGLIGVPLLVPEPGVLAMTLVGGVLLVVAFNRQGGGFFR